MCRIPEGNLRMRLKSVRYAQGSDLRTDMAFLLCGISLILLYLREVLNAPVPLLPIIVIIIVAVMASAAAPQRRYMFLGASMLLFASAIFSMKANTNSDKLLKLWRTQETESITKALISTGRRIELLEKLSAETGDKVKKYFLGEIREIPPDSIAARVKLFEFLDSVVKQAETGDELQRGSEMGVQILDSQGKRIAWAGWPQMLLGSDQSQVRAKRELIYTRRVSLYRILTHIIPVSTSNRLDIASIIIDIPLEANYKVNNKFLKSTSLTDELAELFPGSIKLDYYLIPEAGKINPRREDGESGAGDAIKSDLPPGMEMLSVISGNEASGLAARASIKSTLGDVMLSVSVKGRTLNHFMERYRERYVLASKALVLAALLIVFVLMYGRLLFGGSRRSGAAKASLLAAFMVLFRYSLLSIDLTSLTRGMTIFDPAIFATPLLHGIMRSAGDMLITSIFLVVLIYGILKIARNTQRERVLNPQRARGVWASILKAVTAAAILMLLLQITDTFINAVVVNANPRLIGTTVNLLDSKVIILHLGVFLMLTGLFVGGILAVWGILRLRGRGNEGQALLLTSILLFAASVWHWGVIMGAASLLILTFIYFAPRSVRREDLVSIVTASLYIVIIISGISYLHFNNDYQKLRMIFIHEKASEIANPSDNWKSFVIEDILENAGQDPSFRRAFHRPESNSVRRLSFDCWAGSSLSLFGYSSAVYVLDRGDSLVSSFAVDMPFRLDLSDGSERVDAPAGKKRAVLDLSRNTVEGMVRFYRGIENLEDFQVTPDGRVERISIGKVIIDVPYFFENITLASQTGPRTPEILRNIQAGGIEPRLEEPEALLLARLKGSFVRESSLENLPAGSVVDKEKLETAAAGKWPILILSGASYRIIIEKTESPGTTLLAGFKLPSLLSHGLRLSMLLSLYMIIAFGLLIAVVALKRLPPFRNLLPTLTPGRRMGFQQKLLASFFVVAIVPAIILGIFSVHMIKERFIQASREEALAKAFSARKALTNILEEEFKLVSGNLDVEALGKGEIGESINIPDDCLIIVFDESEYSGGGKEIILMRDEGDEYAGLFSPSFTVDADGIPKTYRIYYGKKLTSDLLGAVADQVGADVNIYESGSLAASSRMGLLASGLISPIMDMGAFVKVSLLGAANSLATERAGDYRYQVAYLPLAAVGESGSRRAALSLPLLFRPESYHLEAQRATSVVLGIFALLFAATIGLGLILARGIFRPLKTLLEGTKRIARGDLSVKLSAGSADEIGTVIAAFNEMTDQLAKSQTALEQRRRYLETILASIGTGVISTDADNRIITFNRASEAILGITAGDAAGSKPSEVAASGLLPEFFTILEKSARSDEAFLSSEMNLDKSGSRCTIKYMCTKLTYNDSYLGIIFVFEDLTELINSKKLSAWIEMSRQIAHEIKNPLTPIRLSAQFMSKAYNEQSPKFDKIFKESTDTIIQQVDVLKKIAAEFSSFGKMQKLILKPHELAPLIESTVRPYRNNSSGIKVSLHVSSLDIEVIMEPEAFRKICSNLIENAFEAMPGGGELRISVSRTVIDSVDFVRISFCDTGQGLDIEARDRLFEPYFSTKTTGTGLGLAICRTLSREMGGDVSVEDLPGGGAEAVLTLKTSSGGRQGLG